MTADPQADALAAFLATHPGQSSDHDRDPWLADVEATTRRLTAQFGLSLDPSLYGGHCVTCEERWALPADKAACAHMPICEDCWPNGCADCERQVEEDLQRREKATVRIRSAVLELRTGADDLSEADLRSLDWRDRKDVQHHAALAIEALTRVVHIINSQEPTHE